VDIIIRGDTKISIPDEQVEYTYMIRVKDRPDLDYITLSRFEARSVRLRLSKLGLSAKVMRRNHDTQEITLEASADV